MVKKEVSSKGEWKNIQWDGTITGRVGEEDWKGKDSTWEHILIVLKTIASINFYIGNQKKNNELGEEF